MEKLAMLISYHWCSGCHSCEVACQMEHGFSCDEGGIVLSQVGPWRLEGERWQYDHVPHISRQCDLCAERLAKGKKAACEQACQARCLKVGPADELAKEALGKEAQLLIIGRQADLAARRS